MVNALAALIGAQLVGELLRQLLHLPLPGPVIGMFILAVGLLLRHSGTPKPGRPAMTGVAEALIANMGLLFVPAGVGIVTESHLLREYWLSILVGLVASTILGLLATGVVMHHTALRRASAPEGKEAP